MDSRCTLRELEALVLAIFGVIFQALQLRWNDTAFLADALVGIELTMCFGTLVLQTFTGRAEFGDGLVEQELLKSPLLDVLLFIFSQLTNILDGALKDRTLVLLTSRNNLGKFIDAFIDSLPTTTLNC